MAEIKTLSDDVIETETGACSFRPIRGRADAI